MTVTLTIVRYPGWLGWGGFLSMAVFRLPLWFNKNISFWKLMGCGKNGTFDTIPDLRQWAVLLVSKQDSNSETTPAFFHFWWKFFGCKIYTMVLEPIEGHGRWDGKTCFGELPRQTDYEGRIAILTRATIRLQRLPHFWKQVDAVARQMNGAEGFMGSVGIGEIPWIKQATFSVWESKMAMKQFAYRMKEHTTVIEKTRSEKWYSEDMFTRFIIRSSQETPEGFNPLGGKL